MHRGILSIRADLDSARQVLCRMQHEVDRKEDQQVREYRDELHKRLESTHGPEIHAQKQVIAQLEEEWAAAKTDRALNDTRYPPGTRMFLWEWVETGGPGLPLVLTASGIVEVYQTGVKVAPVYRESLRLGDRFVRKLKKDGSPGLNIYAFSASDTPPPGWYLEENNPNEIQSPGDIRTGRPGFLQP